jgi:hypothetical protein
VVLAVGEDGEPVIARDHRVLGPVGQVDDRVAGADLVHRAIDPGQARPFEHEEDLLLGGVLVHRAGPAAGVDVDARHANHRRAGRLAEAAERRAHLAHIAALALDLVPVSQGHSSPSQ